jgi:hypothetical protein
MSMHRKNKAPRCKPTFLAEPWFVAHKRRSRIRDRMAKLSRRRNRS